MKTKTYTKINTLYQRYMNLNKVDLPNPKWKAFQNKIILGVFSDDYMEYIKELKFDCFSKIDGTNSKIVYYPSTGKCFPSGKSDSADIVNNGQGEFLNKIIETIKPKLAELFPKESAKFVPVVGDDNKVQYYTPSIEIANYGTMAVKGDVVENIGPYDYMVELTEDPVYIYGEFFGKKIQKGGNYDKDNNRFNVFDICIQGWYIPVDMLKEYCDTLGLDLVPYIGRMTLSEAEEMVKTGFKTRVPNVSNPDYMEEGIVARPVVPIKNPRGKRIIVKIKTCDYMDLQRAIDNVGVEEYKKFHSWYMDNKKQIESIE